VSSHSEKNDADAATHESIGIGIYEWQLLNHRHQHLLAQTLSGTTALKEVNTPRRRIDDSGRGGDSVSSDDRTPPQRVSLIGANQEPVRGRAGTLPARDARGRFTRCRGSARSADSAASGDSGQSRRSSGVGCEIGSASDLVSSQQSLTWDNFTPPIQQEDDLIFDYETSSTSGLASDTLQERELEQFIEEPDRLTPVDERGESRASTGEHERTVAGENVAGGPSDDVVATANRGWLCHVTRCR
jgi:hypothetical protein